MVTLARLCANYTRQVQLLYGEFYLGRLSLAAYRQRSRELVQQFVTELEGWADATHTRDTPPRIGRQ